jgi:periplasmic mercuric ion binding protein
MSFPGSIDPEFAMKKLFLIALFAASAGAVHAAPQTVTLDVPGMTCAACPITVKISKVDGVSKVDVSYEKRQAVVTFDDAKASAQKLTQATENAGYPSTVKR